MTELQLEYLIPVIRGFGQELLSISRSTEPVPHEDVERTIKDVYKLLDQPAPQVVWLANPWQLSLAVMSYYEKARPLQARLHHDEELLARKLRATVFTSFGQEAFDSLFNVVWSSLPADELGMLPGMVETEIVNRRRDESRQTEWHRLQPTKQSQWTWGIATDLMRERVRIGWLSAVTPRDAAIEWSWRALLKLALGEISRRYLNLNLDQTADNKLDRYLEFAFLMHAHMCFEDVVFVSERPILLCEDENRRFHSATGPAIAYRDGFEVYAWHGTRVPARAIVEEPHVALIENELNVESRRVLIERYGLSRYLLDSGAEVLSEDKCGKLYRRENFGDEPIVMVQVTNSTPEPDGTYKTFFLRVPPQITTAREAVAWTFGMTPDEYSPGFES